MSNATALLIGAAGVFLLGFIAGMVWAIVALTDFPNQEDGPPWS